MSVKIFDSTLTSFSIKLMHHFRHTYFLPLTRFDWLLQYTFYLDYYSWYNKNGYRFNHIDATDLRLGSLQIYWTVDATKFDTHTVRHLFSAHI